MLKWYADICALTDYDLTTKALRRTWALTLASLFVVPLFLILKFDVVLGVMEDIAYGALLLSAIALIVLCFSRFTNRFWARDRYLAEWERSLKRGGMTFAFQVIMWVISSLVILLFIAGDASTFDSVSSPSVSLLTIGYSLFGVVLAGAYLTHFYILLSVQTTDEFLAEDDLSLRDVI